MTDSMTQKKWPRRLAYSLLGVLGLLVCAVIAARFFINSDNGRAYIASKIEALQPAGQSVTIEGLSGDVLDTFTAGRVIVSDANGPWLDARNVRVSWTPWGLLKGRVAIEDAQATTVEILALPELKPSEKSGPQRINTLNIQALKLPEVTIANTVLPRAQTLSLAGSLSHSPEGGALKTQAASLGAPALDKMTADIRWSPDFLVTGDAKLVSKPSGLISTVLRLKSEQTLTVDMTTASEGRVFETTITGMLGAETVVNAALTSTGGRQDVSGTLNPYILPVLKPYAAMFGGEIKASAKISREGETLRVDGGFTSQSLKLDGTAEQTESGFEFPRLNVSSADPLALFPDWPVSLGSAGFKGRAAWGEDVTATGRVSLKAAEYQDLELSTVSGPVDVSRQGERLNFAIDLTGQVERSNALNRWSGGVPKMKSSGHVNLETRALSLGRTVINVPGVKVDAKGRVQLSDMRANLGGTLSLKKAALGLSLPADVSGAFDVRDQAGGFHVAYSGEAQNFAPLPEPLQSLAGDRAVFKGTLILDDAQNLEVPELTVSTQGLSADIKGARTKNGVLEATLDYAAQPFSVSQLSAEGTQGTANIGGTLGALAFTIEGASPKITVSNRVLSGVTYKAKGRKDGGAIEADIALTGQDDLGAMSLDAKGLYQDGTWAFQNLASEFSGLSISGDVSGQGGDLARLKSDLKITGNPSDFMPAQDIDLTVNLANETARITGSIQGINAGPLIDASAEINAKGPRGAVDFAVRLKGDTRLNDITRSTDMALTGTVDLMAPDLGVTASLDGNLGQFTLQSMEPLTVMQSNGGYEGAGRVALLGGEFAYTLGASAPALTLDAQGLSLASLLALSGRPGVEGAAGFKAKAVRAGAGFNGTFVSKLENVRQPGSKASPLDLDITAALTGGKFTFNARSQNPSLAGALEVSGALESKLSPPFIIWPPQEAMPGTLTANGDIGTVAEIFLPLETNAAGTIQLDTAFTLPLDIGGMRGKMTLTDGEFEQGRIGMHLIDMSFESDFNGNSVRMSNFNAKGKSGGTVTGGGTMALGRSEGGAITLTANGLHVFDRREGFADVSGTLDFTRDAEKLKLAGTLTVDDAKVSLDRFPRAGLPTLDVNFGDDTDETAENLQYLTELDVSITSAGRIALRGRGVNAAMALKANFTGPFEAPVLKGEASIVRGRFDFLGKRFELKDSRVLFRDNIMDSRLDAKAVRETSDLTATVRVGGTLKRPQIDLQSEPTLPEDEVLSYILFGRSASQLTTIETARLAAALAQLSGGGGFDLLGGLEDSLGLDTLDFAQSETGQTQLATGKYLSDDVYVEVRSSVEGSPGLAVEWTPRKNIAVEAETSPGDMQRVSVRWKKDFD